MPPDFPRTARPVPVPVPVPVHVASVAATERRRVASVDATERGAAPRGGAATSGGAPAGRLRSTLAAGDAGPIFFKKITESFITTTLKPPNENAEIK